MDFDPSLTFDSFEVGAANRLASAAARRAAESPGTTYNPLFLYSAPGLGKSHILSAIGQHAAGIHSDIVVLFRDAETYLDEFEDALDSGSVAALREQYENVGMLIIDDVQLLGGHPEAQETLLRVIDELAGRGAQIVLASDQPPTGIDGLDRRLIKRFSDGLIVDVGPPDEKTRLTILEKRAEQNGTTLAEGVAAAIAGSPSGSVRDLLSRLDHVAVLQEEQGRAVTPTEVEDLFGAPEPARSEDGPRARRRRTRQTEKATPTSSRRARPGRGARDAVTTARSPSEEKGGVDWRKAVREAAEAARVDGITATPLLELLEERESPIGWRTTLRAFGERANRLREIHKELETIGDPWPEASAGLLTDTERLEEAEELLRSAHERTRPFARLPEGPRIDRLVDRFPELAIKAAEQLVRVDAETYNPLYLHSPRAGRARELLYAVGRSFLTLNPEATVAPVSAVDFADELVWAITEGLAGAWRERWWSVDLLLLYGVERMHQTERALDEFLHLFQALGTRSARIVLAADRPPRRLEGLPERLAEKLEEGLVVDLGAGPEGEEAAPVGEDSAETPSPVSSLPSRPSTTDDDLSAIREFAGVGSATLEGNPAAAANSGPDVEVFRPDPERVVWDWPHMEDRIADWGESGPTGGEYGD